MSGMSDHIERFILGLLLECQGNAIEIKRNELAQYFGCAPSQINYVLTTRFSLEKGYMIESKRGGGGYISVSKIQINESELSMLVFEQIGQEISVQKSKAIIERLLTMEMVTTREAYLMKAVISENAMIPVNIREHVRANTLKRMIATLLQNQENEETCEGRDEE